MQSDKPGCYELFIRRYRARALQGLLHRAVVTEMEEPRRAVVVWNGKAYPGGTTIFTWHRPEYRHCFVFLDITAEMGGTPYCILLDSQAHMSKLDVFQMSIPEIATFYGERGCPTFETFVRAPRPRMLTPIWLDCVQQTKRFLGITKWFIWTPYQLLCFLRRESDRLARQDPEAVDAPADPQLGTAQSD